MAIKKTAGSKTTAGKKSAPLDPKVADKLLDLLSTDNEFRRLFKKDPEAALLKVGYTLPQETLKRATKVRKGPPFAPPGPPEMRPPTMCLKVRNIAPKATIAASRAEIKEMLTGGLAYISPLLDASLNASRRTRK